MGLGAAEGGLRSLRRTVRRGRRYGLRSTPNVTRQPLGARRHLQLARERVRRDSLDPEPRVRSEGTHSVVVEDCASCRQRAQVVRSPIGVELGDDPGIPCAPRQRCTAEPDVLVEVRNAIGPSRRRLQMLSPPGWCRGRRGGSPHTLGPDPSSRALRRRLALAASPNSVTPPRSALWSGDDRTRCLCRARRRTAQEGGVDPGRSTPSA